MKKTILAIILTFLMLCNSAFASSQIYEGFFNTLSDEWTVSVTGGGSPSAAADGGVLNIQFGTTDTASNKRAMITSPVMTIDEQYFAVSLKSTVTGDDATLSRTLTMRDSANKSKTILSFTGTELKFFDSTVYETELINGQEYSFTIYFDEKQGNAYVWIDNACVFTQELSEISWPSFVSSRQLRFENRGTRATAESVWIIDDLKVDTETQNVEMSTVPTDGAKMVKLTELEKGIELNYGKIMAPITYDTDNYILYVNETESRFTLSEDDDKDEYKVYIIPENGFSYDADYRLVVREIKTLDNVLLYENYEINFDSEIENYVFPVIKTNKDEYTYYLGEKTSVIVDIETEMDIENVKFTVEGEIIEEFASPESKTVILEKVFGLGTYYVTINITDDKGGTAEPKTVKITVIENNAPVVDIIYPNSAKLLSKADNDTITVNAEDSDGEIDRVELYVDGEFYAEDSEAPYEFTPTQMAAGVRNIKAIAYDSYGLSTQDTGTVTVVIKQNVTIKADNITFDTYTGDNNTFPTTLGFGGTINQSKNAFIKGGYVDDYEENGGEHGRSVMLGALGEGKGDGAWMSFPTGSVQGTADIEFDFYIYEKANSFSLYLRASAGGDSQDIKFNKSGIVLGNNGGSSVTIPYEAKKWYRAKYVFDIMAKKYSFYLYNAETGAYDCYAKDFGMASATISQLATCRLIVPDNFEGYNFIAIDNVTSVVTSNYPYISAVTYGKDGTDGEVDISTDRINIKLSSTVDGTSLTTEKIKIYSSDDVADISSFTYENGIITVMLARPLISNETYIVELAKNVKLATGENIGEALFEKFKTAPQDFDVYNGSFSKNGSNIKFTADLKNISEEDISAWVIMTVFEGKKVKSTTVKKYTFRDELPAELSAPYTEGNTVMVTVWDSLVMPRFISNKIYNFRGGN